MGIRESLSPDKESFLGVLRFQLQEQATKELKTGKLVSPASLDEVSSRLIPALRKSVLTSVMLKRLKVEDAELRNVLKNALVDAGVEVV